MGFEGDLPLRVHWLGAEAYKRSSGSLKVLVLEFKLLKAIIVQNLGRTAWVDKDSLNQEVLQLQGEDERVVMREFDVLQVLVREPYPGPLCLGPGSGAAINTCF